MFLRYPSNIIVQHDFGTLARPSHLYRNCDLAQRRQAISTRVIICNDDILFLELRLPSYNLPRAVRLMVNGTVLLNLVTDMDLMRANTKH